MNEKRGIRVDRGDLLCHFLNRKLPLGFRPKGAGSLPEKGVTPAFLE